MQNAALVGVVRTAADVDENPVAGRQGGGGGRGRRVILSYFIGLIILAGWPG